MNDKPEHYSTDPAEQLSNQQLAETWNLVAKQNDLMDGPEKPMDVIRLTKRVNELEDELMERGFQPVPDDDGMLFGVENEDGEQLV